MGTMELQSHLKTLSSGVFCLSVFEIEWGHMRGWGGAEGQKESEILSWFQVQSDPDSELDFSTLRS